MSAPATVTQADQTCAFHVRQQTELAEATKLIADYRTSTEASFKAREDALVEALRRIAGECGPHSQPFPESDPDYPAFAVMEARQALTDFARAHTAADAGGE